MAKANKSRKDRRKQLRAEKKQRKAQWFGKKTSRPPKRAKMDEDEEEDQPKKRVRFNDKQPKGSKIQSNRPMIQLYSDDEDSETPQASNQNLPKKSNLKNSKQSANQRVPIKGRPIEDIEYDHRNLFRQGIEKEDQIIKDMEKKLGLKQRKRQTGKETLPASFYYDGLGYILDAVDKTGLYEEEDDPNKIPEFITKSSNKNDTDMDESEDKEDGQFFVEEDEVEVSDEERPNHRENADEDDDQEGDEDVDDLEESDNEESDEGKLSSNEDQNESDMESDDEEERTQQDIYGRLRDKGGNIIDNQKKEDAHFGDEAPIDEALLRKIRGLLNKLTTSNIVSILKEFSSLINEHSRYQVIESIWQSIKKSVLNASLSMAPQKLVAELALFVAILYHNHGEEMGGHILHRLVHEWRNLTSTMDDSKRLDNLLAFFVNLMVCGLIDPPTLFDIAFDCVDKFNEKTIELLVFLLRTVGFTLRKEAPLLMKELIVKAQSGAAKYKASSTRTKFMLDALIAIRNNNPAKLPNYGTEISTDLIHTTLKAVIGKQRVKSLPGKLTEIEINNRWWMRSELLQLEKKIPSTSKTESTGEEYNAESFSISDKLCKKLGLNTPLRKTIFQAMVTSSDYMEAFERLVKVGKKQHQDVIHVILHVACREKTLNPFYVYLLKQLAQRDRHYLIGLKFAILDRVKELDVLTENQRSVLADLIAELLKLDVTVITVLRSLEWSNLSQINVGFIRNILSQILQCDDEAVKKIFSKINPEKDVTFARALKMFISCFIKSKELKQKGIHYVTKGTKKKSTSII